MKKHSKKNKKHQKQKESGHLKSVVICLLVFVGSILLFIFSNHSSLQEVRDSFIVTVIFKLAITATVVFFTFRNKKELPKIGWLLSLLFSAVPWITVITLSNKIYLIYITVLFFVMFGYLIMKYLKELKVYNLLYLEATFLALFMIKDARAYSFIENPRGLHFWVAPLIIGIIAGIISFFLVRMDLLDYTTANLVLMPIVACFVFFMITWTTALNMNYALDISEPVEHTAIIVDKDVDTAGKSVDYSFILELNGKTIELDVSSSNYYSYEIGDEFIIEYRRGAFNEPFYISS